MITIKQMWNRITNSIGKVLISSSSSAGKVGSVNCSVFSTKQLKMALMQQFGFASLPPDLTEGIFVSVNGNRENSYVIATHHRASYPQNNLEIGEAIIYNSDGVGFIKIKEGGDIEINQVGSTGMITINGNVNVVGNIVATGTIIGSNFP